MWDMKKVRFWEWLEMPEEAGEEREEQVVSEVRAHLCGTNVCTEAVVGRAVDGSERWLRR